MVKSSIQTLIDAIKRNKRGFFPASKPGSIGILREWRLSSQECSGPRLLIKWRRSFDFWKRNGTGTITSQYWIQFRFHTLSGLSSLIPEAIAWSPNNVMTQQWTTARGVTGGPTAGISVPVVSSGIVEYDGREVDPASSFDLLRIQQRRAGSFPKSLRVIMWNCRGLKLKNHQPLGFVRWNWCRCFGFEWDFSFAWNCMA